MVSFAQKKKICTLTDDCLIHRLRNLARGIQLPVHEVKGMPEKDPIDYQAAMQRLSTFEENLMLKTGKLKKQKKRKLEPSEDGDKSGEVILN